MDNYINDEFDFDKENKLDSARLNSNWLQFGTMKYREGDSKGDLELLMGGNGYSFPNFPLDVWEAMKESGSAGSVLWDTVWFGRRTKSVGKSSGAITSRLTRKQKISKYKQKGLAQRRQKTLKTVRSLNKTKKIKSNSKYLKRQKRK